jgi:hypothetical protein
MSTWTQNYPNKFVRYSLIWYTLYTSPGHCLTGQWWRYELKWLKNLDSSAKNADIKPKTQAHQTNPAYSSFQCWECLGKDVPQEYYRRWVTEKILKPLNCANVHVCVTPNAAVMGEWHANMTGGKEMKILTSESDVCLHVCLKCCELRCILPNS